MIEVQVQDYYINLFDVIKVWLYSDFLLIEIGQFELNCNVDNFFVENEQVVFVLSNLVLGIGVLLDCML